YDWREAAGNAPYSWLLSPSEERRGLAARLRAAALKDDRRKLEERLLLLRDVVSGKAGAAERLATQFPEDAGRLGPAGQAREIGSLGTAAVPAEELRLVGTLSAAQAAALLARGAWISERLRAGGGPL